MFVAVWTYVCFIVSVKTCVSFTQRLWTRQRRRGAMARWHFALMTAGACSRCCLELPFNWLFGTMAPSERCKRVFYNMQGLPPHWGHWAGGLTYTEKAAELYCQCCACGILLVNVLACFRGNSRVSVCLSQRGVSVMGMSASLFDG